MDESTGGGGAPIYTRFVREDNRTVPFDMGLGDTNGDSDEDCAGGDGDCKLASVKNAPIEEDLVIVNVVGV